MIFRRANPLQGSLTRTRQTFFGRIASLLTQSDITEFTWSELEALLLQADVGVATTMAVVDALREKAAASKVRKAEDLPSLMRQEMVSTLRSHEHRYLNGPAAPLNVVLVVGVNGSGKTTSIAKLARYHQLRGDRVLLAAADTFRAAASDQLSIWADRLGVDIVAHQPGGDPGAVLYDALAAAQSRGRNVVLVDTAGRLHTKYNLMQELAKLGRIATKQVPGAPQETLVVLDATTGQNGLEQARVFREAVPVTGLILAKLDGTARGGIAFAVEQELGIPVVFVGTGEKPEDLAEFEAEAFVDGLLQ
jgi:fused signal recognition particle receptor